MEKNQHGERVVLAGLFGARVPTLSQDSRLALAHVNLDKGSQFWFRGSFSDSPRPRVKNRVGRPEQDDGWEAVAGPQEPEFAPVPWVRGPTLPSDSPQALEDRRRRRLWQGTEARAHGRAPRKALCGDCFIF